MSSEKRFLQNSHVVRVGQRRYDVTETEIHSIIMEEAHFTLKNIINDDVILETSTYISFGQSTKVIKCLIIDNSFDTHWVGEDSHA